MFWLIYKVEGLKILYKFIQNFSLTYRKIWTMKYNDPGLQIEDAEKPLQTKG